MGFTLGSKIIRATGWIIAVLDLIGLLYWVAVSIWAMAEEPEHLFSFILSSLHISVPVVIFLTLDYIWESGDEASENGVPHWRTTIVVVALFFFFLFADILVLVSDLKNPEPSGSSLTAALQALSGIQVGFAAVAFIWGLVFAAYVLFFNFTSESKRKSVKKFLKGESKMNCGLPVTQINRRTTVHGQAGPMRGIQGQRRRWL